MLNFIVYNSKFYKRLSVLSPLFSICFLLLFGIQNGCTVSDTPEQNKKYSLLFVGNSLTYTNDLPSLVKNYAELKGKDVDVEMLALPNYALVDHLADGVVQSMIHSTKFTHVIVQQGPSSQQEGRTLLLEAASDLKVLCEQNNSTLAFYMVWPAYENYHHFDGVIKNYTDAALLNGALLCPVGKKWKEYIDATGDLSYYGKDNFHPSLKGSEVASKVIFESLFE